MVSKILSLYNSKRLLFNATLSVVQVIALGGTYFIVYTFLLKNLGSQKLGTWSVVLSTSSVASIANIGLSSSLIKFIASYSIERDIVQINKLIKTSLISIAVFVGFISILLYCLGYFLLSLVLPPSELSEARILLPFSLLSLWINSLASIFLSTLDGIHSSSIRSLVYIVSAFIFIILVWQFLPHYGLTSISVIQVIQAFTILILSVTGVKYVFKGFILFPLRWDKETFNQIFKFSSNFQIIGLCQLLYDPVTKFLLSRYGGLSFVGYYEMASRLVVQIRTLIVSANQVIVPSIASSSEKNIDKSYPKILNLVIGLAFPVMVAVMVFTPSISYYWIGSYEPYFIWALLILTLSWLINILCTPAYFSSIGLGNLRGILFSHVFIAILNLVLGWGLGYSFGGLGVIIAWGMSLSLGSLFSLVYYNKKYRKNEINVKRNQFSYILFSSFSFVLIYYFLFYKESNILSHKEILYYSIILYCCYLLSIFMFFVRNKSVIDYIKTKTQSKYTS